MRTGDEAKGLTGNLKVVNHSWRKKDADQLITGKPVYTQDIAPKDCLVVKVLESPYANAIIEDIDTSVAEKVPGVAAVFTWKDVDQNARRYTKAGATFPESSPYDRLLLDRHMRYIGDGAAIVAGEDEKCVDKAMRLIKIKWNVLEPVLDMHKAIDNKILVHPEDNWESIVPVGADNKRNLCAHSDESDGDVEAVLKSCDIVIDETYHTQACHQGYMEPFCTWCTKDPYGRLVIVSSTQIVFHVRRNVANALHIPKSMIRVVKPRIGGGFGAKQTSVMEMYPAFVTWKTGRNAKMVFTRRQCLTQGTPRHEMEMHVRLGAMKDGTIRGIYLHTLSNTGAYGEHGPTTVGLSGHKTIPLYRPEAFRFVTDVVYTNINAAGAYRGFGATQGMFAVESAVNELCHKLHRDPMDLRLQNIAHEGDIMPGYYNEPNTSSNLDRCIQKVREMSGWDAKYPGQKFTTPDGRHMARTVGMAIAMQGSSISAVDVGGATLRLEEGGFYMLILGCADMGTGCDTILAQIAAEALDCPLDKIQVSGADTDTSPYDSGSYASSTTYLTGRAVRDAALELRKKIIREGARLLGCPEEDADFDGEYVRYMPLKVQEPSENKAAADPEEKKVSLNEIAERTVTNITGILEATNTQSSPTSPPPYMAGVAELLTDLDTGECRVENYYGAIDCGTTINPNLARVQAEGGILQGIGMALYEGVHRTEKGALIENSFMQYKMPARPDIGQIHISFDPSYEHLGPYGAKSIGELVIDTPCPAVAEAVYNACGVRMRTLPITREDIAMAGIKGKEGSAAAKENPSLR
ncbi:MAG: molybdopterin-dependent oxidoreductase [Lachnospiraceae bacterium]|jgi:putative selenate reductase molybdopterin-binding subunit|nr:molybdopterin-dependent oxidoreductase [Lachnospiraceae bacterium]